MFRAAFNNHKDVAVLLIQAGAILAKADSCGSTALDVALDRAHIDTITLLVQAGEGARQPTVSCSGWRYSQGTPTP